MADIPFMRTEDIKHCREWSAVVRILSASCCHLLHLECRQLSVPETLAQFSTFIMPTTTMNQMSLYNFKTRLQSSSPQKSNASVIFYHCIYNNLRVTLLFKQFGHNNNKIFFLTTAYDRVLPKQTDDLIWLGIISRTNMSLCKEPILWPLPLQRAKTVNKGIVRRLLLKLGGSNLITGKRKCHISRVSCSTHMTLTWREETSVSRCYRHNLHLFCWDKGW